LTNSRKNDKIKCHTSRGDSGALYPQPALVEVKPNIEGGISTAGYVSDVENKVPYSEIAENRVRSGRKQH